MADDWNELLDMDSEAAVKPPPLPKGHYRALIEEYKMVKSSQKQTPGVEFTFTQLDPQSDVDPEKWQEFSQSPAIIAAGAARTDTFWLTQKSMYRLKDFCETAGVVPEGKKMRQLVAETKGNTILIQVGHEVSQKDGQTVFDTIQGFAKDV